MPEQRIDAYSWQLSGGLRQRAMIAMALSCKPRLLIADEPTTAIDVTTQAQVLALLRDLQAKYNTAIIFITHDLGVIAQMANYVVVMYLGRVMEEGPVDDIFHAPKHPYTKALLRSIPSLLRRDARRAAGHQRRAAASVQPPARLSVPSALPEVHAERCSTAVPSAAAGGDRAAGELLPVQRRGGAGMSDAAVSRCSTCAACGSSSRSPRASCSASSATCAPSTTSSFTVNEGETLGLVGESGCGKTTASRCILRAIDPTGGQILYRTRDGTVVDLAPMSPAELLPLRAEIQMIFQDPFGSLNPRMTLFDNVGEPLLVNGMRQPPRARWTAWPSCCAWSACGPSSCTASRMPSAAASASASASRARSPPARAWSWPTSRSRRSTSRCRRRC